MNYPKRWSSLFAYHQQKISAGVSGIYNPDDANKTFTILFLPTVSSKAAIHGLLLEKMKDLPQELLKKLYIQPEENIHFSIQWCDKRKVKGEKSVAIIRDLELLISECRAIKGDLYLPFTGYGTLYGLVKTEQIDLMVDLRLKIKAVFERYGIKTGIPEEDFDLIHTSLVRSYEVITTDELDILKKIEIEMVPIVLDRIVIAINDKVMSSQGTQILYSVTI